MRVLTGVGCEWGDKNLVRKVWRRLCDECGVGRGREENMRLERMGDEKFMEKGEQAKRRASEPCDNRVECEKN